MKRLEKQLSAALLAALLSAVAFLWASPFLWTLVASFRPEGAGSADMASLLPNLHPTLENFRNALESGSFGLYYVNTIIIVTGVLAVQCVTVSLAGYAFARLRFPGRDLVFGIMVAALMVPPIFTLLPNFTLVKSLGAIDTFAGMVAPSLLMTPFAVFFLRQFFLSIPKEVEEAAIIDGAGRWGVFWRVVMPMSRGPLITIALTTSVWAWKDYLWPLLVGRGEQTRVLTVALGVFLQQSPNTQPDWTGLMAASTLSVLPVLALLIFLGKRLVQSLNFTGIK